MPIQAAKARKHMPSRTPPTSSEDPAKYGPRASKVPPKANRGQDSRNGASSEDLVPTILTPSIPDAPTSQNNTPPSGAPRKAQLVPPSSQRRGGSSLYSQGTSFSPILEESQDSGSKRRASSASSSAVPSSWASHPDDYNFDRIQEKVEEEEEVLNPSTSPNSTASRHDETTGLVRQASMGQRMRPSVTRIRNSSEHISSKKETVGLSTIAAGAGPGATAHGSSRENNPTAPARSSPFTETIGNRTFIIDSSPPNSRSSSQNSGKGALTLVEPIGRSRSPLGPAADRAQPNPLCGIHRPDSKGPSISDRVPSKHRPPHLDMDAVRDAESRGSITSLPDLIRRATRLAANLDRGKTASRSGMLDMPSAEKMERRRRSGSISDILASFPPPSRGTPDGTRSESRWPSPFPSKLVQRFSSLTSHGSGSTQFPANSRRCCGMSLPAFIIVMLLLAILVAAAIAVPVVLIVLPRQRQAAANDTRPSVVGHCPDPVPCHNGGFSVVSDDSCRCICTNGFTGDRCSIIADPGCMTTDIGTGTERFSNATLGTAIPRLLSGASTNYSIPLNSSAILVSFSTNNLSCTSENALVTFKSQNMEERDVAQQEFADAFLLTTRSASPLRPTPVPRVGLSFPLELRQVDTINGIVFQTSATTTVTSTPSSQSSPIPSTSTSSSPTSSAPPASKTLSAEAVDFARIAVLFVLDQTGELKTAVNAQDNIQDFLLNRTNPSDTMSIRSHGVDLSLNFANFSIALGNGTELGGKGNGNGGIRDIKTKRARISGGWSHEVI